MNKILICGSRHFDDYSLLETTVNGIREQLKFEEDIEIVSGHCVGADLLGETYAQKNNVSLKTLHADWQEHGKAAGPIRNKKMVDYIKGGNSCVIAFAGNNSRGTMNTISLAKKEGIPVFVINI